MHFFNELFGSFVGRFIGEVEFIFGTLLGLGLWSMDHAVIELRHRRLAYALGCALVGVALLMIGLLAARDWPALTRISLAGLLVYAPLRVWLARHRA